jgi:phage terminase large subunit
MLDMARESPDWFAEVLTVDDTQAISAEAVERSRREYRGIFGQEAGDALIEQEYYCSFEAAVLGSYWGALIRRAEQEGRIIDLPVASDLSVQTAWDIGVDDAMAIWCFQVYPDRLHIVDYYENHGLGFDHYCRWLDERGYHGTDWVPHDAKIREVGAPGARTRIETLVTLGRKPALVPNQGLMDGINAGRRKIPVAWFDRKRCARGLDCLREYKTLFDEARHVFLKTPAHDWASHGADAWRYLSLTWRAPGKDPDEPRLGTPDGIPYTKPVFKPLSEMTHDEWEEANEEEERVGERI